MQQRTCPECRVKMEEVQLLDRAPGVAPRAGSALHGQERAAELLEGVSDRGDRPGGALPEVRPRLALRAARGHRQGVRPGPRATPCRRALPAGPARPARYATNPRKSTIAIRLAERKYYCVQPTDSQSDRAGSVRRTFRGCWAFFPGTLPPELDPGGRSLPKRLSEAERSLGRLSGVGATLPNPFLLIRPFVRREAVLSSRIEGTEASLSDLFLYEASPQPEPQTADVKEVANYARALDWALAPRRRCP